MHRKQPPAANRLQTAAGIDPALDALSATHGTALGPLQLRPREAYGLASCPLTAHHSAEADRLHHLRMRVRLLDAQQGGIMFVPT
jgi:hypothetical protein